MLQEALAPFIIGSGVKWANSLLLVVVVVDVVYVVDR